MIWDNNVHIIVMVTTEVEGGTLKAHQYWPGADNKKLTFGPNVVSFISETMSKTYIKREFLIRNLDREMERRLTHFLSTAWQDIGVPNSSLEILDFRKQVRMITPPSSTMLVHCSSGVGRTGIFITVDVIMSAAENQDLHAADVKEILSDLRNCRNHMVQNIKQYKFVYQTAIDGIMCFMRDVKNMLKDMRTSLSTVESDQDLMESVQPSVPEYKNVGNDAILLSPKNVGNDAVGKHPVPEMMRAVTPGKPGCALL